MRIATRPVPPPDQTGKVDCRINRAARGKRGLLVLLALLLGLGTACYRVSGRYGNLPDGIRTIAVPPVENKTAKFALERTLTTDLRQALARKAAVHVVSAPESADAVLRLEIVSFLVTPTGVKPGGTGTAYQVMMTVHATFTERASGKVLFEEPAMIVREPFLLPSTGLEFFPEDTPALERLSARLAENLVVGLLESF